MNVKELANSAQPRANSAQPRANFEQHRANFEQHRANSEQNRANYEQHRANFKQHRANSEQHRANSEQHRANSKQHRANSNQHRANFEQHRANFKQHRANSEQHRADWKMDVAAGNMDVAGGNMDLAGGIVDFEVGSMNLANGIMDFEVGSMNLATGIVDFEVGSMNLASGIMDFEVGSMNLASGIVDFEVGSMNLASGIMDLPGGIVDFEVGPVKVAGGSALPPAGPMDPVSSRSELQLNPMRRTLCLSLGLFLAGPAWGATHRVAVLVGNNAGGQELRPLRYAEADAGKMARVFAEVGGMGAEDLFLVQGQPRASLERALNLAQKRVDGWHQNPADRVLLIFYFSGHSDGEALELGRERVSFDELRQLLGQTGADVRVAIVDSCRSGALLAAKGGRAAASFDIRMTDDLSSTGQVMLASSAADEVALESAQLGGSVFTHYLASGLRGAADSSGDGRVTLTEAYQYAYQHTLANTAVTSFGAQHPTFDYRLSGQGELVLADLSEETASLELPAGFKQAVVNDLRRDQVVAELSEGAGRRLAVDPGEYAVRASRDGLTYLARVEVAEAEHRVVTWDELRPIGDVEGQAKGSDLSASWQPPDPPTTVAAFGGTLPGVALGPMIATKVVVAGREGLGPHLSISFGTGQAPTFRESGLRGQAGWSFGLPLDRFLFYCGPALGGGLAWQSTGGRTALGEVGAEVGVSYSLGRRVAIALEGQAAGELLEENGGLAGAFVPAAWLGVRVGVGD